MDAQLVQGGERLAALVAMVGHVVPVYLNVLDKALHVLEGLCTTLLGAPVNLDTRREIVTYRIL